MCHKNNWYTIYTGSVGLAETQHYFFKALQTVTNPCQILVEQALEMACSASTKFQMDHMKGGTAMEKN